MREVNISLEAEYNAKLERLKKMLKPSIEQANNGECKAYSYEEFMEKFGNS